MKVLVIMGSPRKGNTFRACEEFREHLQRRCTAEFEYVWLKDADMAPCKGCFVCFPHGEEKCPGRDDDVHLIEQKMLDADGVIFATPVYSFTVSGLMKTFIDRISYTGHRPRFFGKKAFLLVTTGMMGDDDTLKYLKKNYLGLGFCMRRNRRTEDPQRHSAPVPGGDECTAFGKSCTEILFRTSEYSAKKSWHT